LASNLQIKPRITKKGAGMLFKGNAISLWAAVTGVALLSSGVSLAKTITVQNLSQDTATGVYTYAVTFDSEAYVAGGDGFVIYDFPGLTSWTLSGSGGSGSLNSSGTLTTSTGPLKLTSTDTGDALTDGNAELIANTDASLVATDNGVTFDDPAVPNLSFLWQGPPTIYTGSATAVLTLDTSVTNGDTDSVDATVDRSGTTPGTSYGTAEGTIFVPASGAVPEPTSGILILSGGLIALTARRRGKAVIA
jgi:hypothetical protein